jgi:uncharacterized protein YaeQ
MALKATIYKANLAIADMDRGYYADHALTIARHPSENDERMMVRLLAFALHAQERMAFGKGLSDPDEPDVWCRDFTGEITHWIEVGQPDDRALLKASGRARQVTVLAYAASTDVWWRALSGKLTRARNLTVQRIPAEQSQALAALAERSMVLQFNVQDSTVWVSTARGSAQLDVTTLQRATA